MEISFSRVNDETILTCISIQIADSIPLLRACYICDTTLAHQYLPTERESVTCGTMPALGQPNCSDVW